MQGLKEDLEVGLRVKGFDDIRTEFWVSAEVSTGIYPTFLVFLHAGRYSEHVLLREINKKQDPL